MRTFFGGLIAGGLIAYFLDPQRRSKATSTASTFTAKAGDAASAVKQQASSVTQQASSVAQGASSTIKSAASSAGDVVREKVVSAEQAGAVRDNPNPDDKTLADRIESEVFRDERVPKGKLNINVADGIVEVRGQLDTQADIDYVIKCVRGVPDVNDVHNYLHLPGTPAPNKAEAIRVSH